MWRRQSKGTNLVTSTHLKPQVKNSRPQGLIIMVMDDQGLLQGLRKIPKKEELKT